MSDLAEPIDGTCLGRLWDTVRHCSQLTYLQLKKLPHAAVVHWRAICLEMCGLTALRCLSIKNVPLHSVPVDHWQLPSGLTALQLVDLGISRLPPAVAALGLLASLHLSFYSLAKLPVAAPYLQNLQLIRVMGNDVLPTVCDALQQAPILAHFFLYESGQTASDEDEAYKLLPQTCAIWEENQPLAWLPAEQECLWPFTFEVRPSSVFYVNNAL